MKGSSSHDGIGCVPGRRGSFYFFAPIVVAMSRQEPSLGDRIMGSPTVQTLSVFVLVFALSWVLRAVAPALFAGLFVLGTPVTLRPWTLVTSVYAHGGLGHLIGNSVALLLVGIPLERATKGWAYHAFFVTTGVIAGLAQVWAGELIGVTLDVLNVLVGWFVNVPASGEVPGVLGASGAIFAMFGYVIAGNRFANATFREFEIPGWAQAVAFGAVAVVLTLWTAAPGVAVIAHFTGLAVGLVAGRIGILPNKRRGSRETGSRGYDPGA